MDEQGHRIERFAHSEAITKIAAALLQLQAKMETAPKDKFNPHFKSRYADLASVWETCRPHLTANGLCVTQLVSSDDPAVVMVTTMLVHSSGEWFRCSLRLGAGQGTPQQIGSAVTYGRRYGLTSILGVITDDDDGAAASRERSGGGYGSGDAPGAEFREAPMDDVQLESAIADWRDAIREAADRDALKKIAAQIGRAPDAVKVAVREDYAARDKQLGPKKKAVS